MLQPIGDPGEVPSEERDPASIRALWTVDRLLPTLVSRVSPDLEEEIAQFEPKSRPTGSQLLTLSFVGERLDANKGCSDFITAAMAPEPEKRPWAAQLLQHSWLKL